MSHPKAAREPSVLALVYTDATAADGVLAQLAMALMERDVALAGLVQHNAPRPGRSRCDMVLEDLGSGRHVAISQDRGPQARGCMLDLGQLLSASMLVEQSLASDPDVVILNKFGKSEAEGGGFRELIGKVIESGSALVIAVPWRNIESWRAFVGEGGHELALDATPHALSALLAHLGYPDDASETLQPARPRIAN
jgi:nucleoside-triphosphatase THEP1